MDTVASPLVGCEASPFTYTACDRETTVYYSTAITANCPVGTSGEPINVQAGYFQSLTSQEDADVQAQVFLQSLTVMFCTPTSSPTNPVIVYASVAATGSCASNDLGGPFTILAGQYSSLISQADADSKAQAHLATLLGMFCTPDPAKRTFSINQTSSGTADYAYSAVTSLAILSQTYGVALTGLAPANPVSQTRIIAIQNILAPLNITILDGLITIGTGGSQSASMTIKRNGSVMQTQGSSSLGTSTPITAYTVEAAIGDVITIEFNLVYSGAASQSLIASSRLQVTYS